MLEVVAKLRKFWSKAKEGRKEVFKVVRGDFFSKLKESEESLKGEAGDLSMFESD